MMNRKAFLKMTAAGALAGPLRTAPGRPSPNIVFILADDLGYGDVTCYNRQSVVPTPNIDHLAAEGVRFTDAHSPSAVCTPTRYGLLTGRYCWRSKLKRRVLYGTDPALIEPGRLTVARLLKDQGYATACVGKWHLGLDWTLKDGRNLKAANLTLTAANADLIDFTQPFTGGPMELGFDYFFGTPAASTTDYLYTFVEGNRTVGIPSEKWEGVRQSREEQEVNDIAYRPGLAVPGWKLEDVDLVFAQKARAFLENHKKRKRDQPFFLYHSLSAPHAPWRPPALTKGKTKGGALGDMVALADWAVGQTLRALDELKLRGNTLVIFASDNGPLIGWNGHQSAGAWRGYKGHIWEGGHRVPFLARWPGQIRANTTSNEVICLTDFMATLASLLDVKLPPEAGPDSYDMLHALLGRKHQAPLRDALVSHSWDGVFSIRRGPWKLIVETEGSGGFVRPAGPGPKPGAPGQLYNLDEDPSESRNLYRDKPQLVAELTALLEKQKRQGYSRPGGQSSE